ncbi:hypothetical protein HDV04_000941 [Boothiomyces sp. JEL0838]|nr:hypothetical protein HDV04_000892 [Boothiomyces sp. JEL0838]KAJ3314218.1 hypothetical protein HDV04_000941 [Boothiomyces sp. JEL0838]
MAMSSRIVVKNLPKYITSERLKKHFGAKGTITDIKLVKTKDGVSRRFAYIGYKTDQQGLDAVEYFNKSFIDTCQIEVQVAKSIGDETIERPWSKYSTGSSAFQRTVKKNEPEKAEETEKKLNPKQLKFLADIEEDDGLKEFLEVMRPRKAAQNRAWGNDDVVAAHANKHDTITPLLPKDEDEDLYQDLPKGLSDDEEDAIEDKPENDAKIAFDSSLSDLDYLRMKMKGAKQEVAEETPAKQETVKIHPGRLAILQEVGAVDKSEVVNTYEAPKVVESTVEPAEEVVAEQHFEEEPSPDLIADTGRIMVRNLAYSCTYEDLEEHFKKFGPIAEIHLPIDKITKESKGYAFIMYVLPENAFAAFTKLDKSIFQGRILEIVAAREKPKTEEDLPTGPQTFKAKREAEKKATSSNDFNWNSLFMNSDAVAEAMARKLGVKKSEILDAESDNMAVRLALAETNIINETKEYLKEEGVSLDAFTSRKQRSNTIILVKNIPSSTEEEELRELFGKFGTLGRVLLPPARTLAVVEFLERNEAKVAFRKLAYSKFKNLPLYLEYAPVGTFIKEYDPEEDAKQRKIKEKKNLIKIEEKEEAEELPPAATVFVKNLNFKTTDSGLKAAFEVMNGLRSARVSTKVNPKQPGVKQSMGFGFLEFNTKEDAMECIKTMQKFNLDGHELQLKFSNATGKVSTSRKRNSQNAEEREPSTKLLVRNLPFEATKKDLKQLFSSCGTLKTVRIPRKFDGQHRGFGFVEFLTAQEAKTAYDTLGATHLYGRHLVIEWAKDEENVDEMRQKTAKAFVKDGNKKRRVEMEGEMDESYD